jgi:hypothetical protein
MLLRGPFVTVQLELIAFGVIEIEGQRYEHDVVIEAGAVRKRRKGPSKPFKEEFGHTPLSVLEDIPWSGKRLVIGTGASGRLPVMDEVVVEAGRRGVALISLPTAEACRLLAEDPAKQVFAILHVTC